MTVRQAPVEASEGDPWDSDNASVTLLATVSTRTEYSLNVIGAEWPYGLYIGRNRDIALFFKGPGAIDRLINQLEALKAAPKGDGS